MFRNSSGSVAIYLPHNMSIKPCSVELHSAKRTPLPLDNSAKSLLNRPVCPHTCSESRSLPPPPFRSSDIDGELFEILIVCNVGIYRPTDDFGAFLAVLLDPFGVFIFDALELFLLVLIYISMKLG